MLNIHPAIVHTPIGLLTLYSMLEVLRFKKLLARPYWFFIKAVLVIVGFGGSLAAIFTGSLAEDGFRGDKVVHLHSNLAVVTSILYGIIAASYLIVWIQKECGDCKLWKQKTIAPLWKMLNTLANFFQKTWILVPLSLIALFFIFMVGALGGAIAYGPDVDPMVSLVYHWFF